MKELQNLSKTQVKNEGVVLSSIDIPYDGKYYYITNERRRWIVSREDADFYNIDIERVKWVDKEYLDKFSKGGNIVGYPLEFKDCLNIMQTRAFLAKDLKGYGVEFEAGVTCHPIPIACCIEYADLYQDNEGCKLMMDGEFPKITYKTDISEMTGIENNSLDFIIHNMLLSIQETPLNQ